MPNAPRTPFNGNITKSRTAAYIQLNLTDVKAVKDRFGVTVNDVMLAVLSGALRRFLLDRNALPQAGLLAMMPVAVSDPARASRNQFAIRMTNLHSDMADPAKRIEAIAEMSSLAKQHTSASEPHCSKTGCNAFPACWRSENAFTNGPGSASAGPCTTWVCQRAGSGDAGIPSGCGDYGQVRLRSGCPRLRTPDIVMSLNGKLDIGLVCCPDLVPDLWDLADGIPAALLELRTAAG